MPSIPILEERQAQIHRKGSAPFEMTCGKHSLAGSVSQRACVFCGSRVVLYPIADALHLIHGPIGCAAYTWDIRGALSSGPELHRMSFSTDLREKDVIFGGEKKLKQAIQEAYDLFHPKAIAVFSTCPVGLIGDDVHQVAKEMKEKLGINVFAFSCEGYKGVSQSAGHHIANNGIFKHVVGLDDTVKKGNYRINLLGEYNIGGDAFEIERLLERCGITLVSSYSGNSSIDAFANSHTADLNLIMCHRSINYVAEMMETKFGVPWIKVNFIGAAATAKSLRKIAQYFDEQELTDIVEQVIAEEMPAVEAAEEQVNAGRYAAGHFVRRYESLPFDAEGMAA